MYGHYQQLSALKGAPLTNDRAAQLSNASVRSMVVIFNTNTAASTGILGWATVDYIKHKRKFSVVGACEGAIAGLVGIAPAAGYVSVWLAACIGFITSIVCSLLQNINDWLNIDEGMDVFKLHGMGGIVGAFLTGLFATENILSLDGFTFSSGAIDGNGIQVGYQLAEICAISGYSFVVSCVLLYILKFIPGMNLRVDEESEMIGLDQAQLFEEQIGDWSSVDNSITETTPTIIGFRNSHQFRRMKLTRGKQCRLDNLFLTMRS
jgi:Amt family ammonium transporter